MTNPTVPPPTAWRARRRLGLIRRGPTTPRPPLDAAERITRYGATGRPLTARQQRRICHKVNRAKRPTAGAR